MHVRILMQIDASGVHEDRRNLPMQCYDEIVRKDWAESARRGDVRFDVKRASLTLDFEAPTTATHLYDTLYLKLTKSADAHRMRPSQKSGGKATDTTPQTCIYHLR